MSPEQIVSLVCGGGLTAVGAFIGLTNWFALVPRRSGRQPSLVPFFGGCLMVAGLSINESLQHYWWMAPIIDWTVLPFLCWWGPQIAIELWKVAEFNVVHRFESVSTDRPEKVVLYRSGYGEVSIPAIVDDDPRHPGFPLRYAMGEWTATADGFVLDGKNCEYGCRLFHDNDAFCVEETCNTIEGNSLQGLRLSKTK